MVRVGSYEIVDERYLSQRGSVSRARRVDGAAGVFAVKRFGGAVDDPNEPRWELQTFLDRARVQQTLAAGGATHWAPVHELGLDVDWAYYVTDFHPLTVLKLIEERVDLKPAALHALVLGIVQGLSELKALRNRTHGDLKPSNVLIGGKDLPDAPVLLTDPASNAQAARVGDAGDLRALGEMIHQLVIHRPHVENQWPVPQAPQWKELGSRGERWRQLCSDLLNPDPGARPRLPAIAQRLALLQSRRRPRFRRLFATAAVLAVAAGTGVGVISALDHSARAQFCQSKRDWFGKFVQGASDPHRRQRWQADADLNRILSEIPFNDLQHIDCDSGRLVRWKWHELQDIQNANTAIMTVQAELPSHWKQAARAAELKARFEQRGWTQPAQYLGGLLDGVRPSAGVDAVAGIDRLIRAAPTVDAGMKFADSDWKLFISRIKIIQTANDPVLSALAGVLKTSASSEVRMSDSGFVGLDELKRDSALADKLAAVLASTFPTNIDREPFNRDVAKAIDAKHAKKEDIARWISLVTLHAYRHEEAAAASVELRKRLNETVELINRARISADEAKAFESASHDATVAIADFEATPFTHRTLDDGTFVRQRDQVRNRIEGLRKFFHPMGPEEWLKALPAVATASERINNYWEAWRKVLADGVPEMVKDANVFKARQQASESLRALLVSLDQDFPPPPPIPNESFMAAAKLRRDQAIDKLLPTLDLGAPRLDPELVKASIGAFNDWTANLVELSHDFPLNKELIGPADHVEEKWKKKPQFWNEPAVQALVKDDVARLDRLTALSTASRDKLAETMTGGGAAEMAMEAWRLLGNPSLKPAWPNTVKELTEEYKFRQALTASLKGLKDPREGDQPTRDLAEQAPIRWMRFVERANSEAMVLAAWNLRKGFKIEPGQTATLSKYAKYNLYLACLRQAIAAGNDDDAQEALANLAPAAAALKDRPEVAHLSDQIAGLTIKEPFADRTPGDSFSIAFTGMARPVEFRRIAPPEGRAFYLCTTAVSMGQFAAVLDAAKSWGQARQLAWPYDPGKADTRRGPRSWEWSGPPSSPLGTPVLWLAPDDYNDYPDAFRAGRFNRMALSDRVGGNPSPDHPIQYISGQMALFYAAICGCRLATPAEWEFAYSSFEKNVPLSHWNLRDQTWETQRRWVAQGGGSRWPDEGIFPGGASQAAVGRTATSRSGNDGTLFFQPVGTGDGVVFHHLVGNVAEFVCDQPRSVDLGAPDKKTAESVRNFLEKWPKSLYVIGGSALSPPEAAFDKPIPVTRPEDAYADVGLRLAFTAPSRSLAEKIQRTIGDPPYFWP